MTRVWVAQCLCPQRHAILATAGEADGEPMAQEKILQPLREAIRANLDAGVINPWCGLCHARADTWLYEVGRTAFRSLEEAAPKLRQLEAAQAAINAMWADMKRSD